MELLDVVGTGDGSCKRLGGGTIHPSLSRAACAHIIRDVCIFLRLRLFLVIFMLSSVSATSKVTTMMDKRPQL